MKKIVFCPLLALFLCLAAPFYGRAQGPEPTDGVLSDTERLEEAVRLLGDEEWTRESLRRLKALLAAQKALEETRKAEAPPKESALDFVALYRKYARDVKEKIRDAKEKVSLVTGDSRYVIDYLAERENLLRLADIGVKLFLAFLAALLLLPLTKGFIRKNFPQVELAPEAGWGVKIKKAFADLLFDLYTLLAIAAALWLFLRLALPGYIGLFSRLLAAYVVYRISLKAAYHVLEPKKSLQRLLKMEDKTASYIFIWCRRLLLYSLWAYGAVIVCRTHALTELAFLLEALYKTGIVAMVTIMMAQWKEDLAAWLRLEVREKDPIWLAGLKRALNPLMGRLYLIVLTYASFLVFLFILRFEELYRYLLSSTWKSALVIALVYGAWRIWGLVFQQLFKISENLQQQLPGLEDHVNRYVTILDRVVFGALFLAGFLFLLEAWRVNVYAFLSEYSDQLFRLVRIPVILAAAFICAQVGGVLIKRFEKKIILRRKSKEDIPEVEIEKQVSTVGGLLRKAIFSTVWIVAALMIIHELGFDITPALAGAGIFGVALGFGTQNLVRDIISGLFMIAENQIRVGDVAILNGTGGLVEAINLRTTVLRGLDGTVHVFPNGTISTLSNMTREFSFYLFEVGVAYKEDVDRVMKVLREIGDEMLHDKEFGQYILDPFEVLGLDKFGDSAIVIKARIKTLPIKQWMVGREMNRRIKNRFDAEGIEIPFPHRTIYFGEASDAFKIKMEQMDK